MAIGLPEQIEGPLEVRLKNSWTTKKYSHKWDKTMQHRKERRRAKKEPTCQPEYRRYYGWEW